MLMNNHGVNESSLFPNEDCVLHQRKKESVMCKIQSAVSALQPFGKLKTCSSNATLPLTKFSNYQDRSWQLSPTHFKRTLDITQGP